MLTFEATSFYLVEIEWNEMLNWIGNKTVTTDELHDFIKSQLSDTYEIGDAREIINEMVAEELLIANDFDVKRKA